MCTVAHVCYQHSQINKCTISLMLAKRLTLENYMEKLLEIITLRMDG